MTPRESRLLVILGVALVAGLGVVGASGLFEVWAALDQRKVAAQKQGLQRAAARGTPREATPTNLFWPRDATISVEALANQTTKRLETVHLPPQEVRVLEDTPDRGWIQVSAAGPASAWLAFVALSYAERPHVLWRNLRIHLKEGTTYDFTFEVGYERLP